MNYTIGQSIPVPEFIDSGEQVSRTPPKTLEDYATEKGVYSEVRMVQLLAERSQNMITRYAKAGNVSAVVSVFENTVWAMWGVIYKLLTQ